MMKLVLRLPYYIHPATPAAEAPILLFLHGIGEGFVNKLGEIGHQNLLRQGPPKHLGTLAPDHPLLNSFTLVAPQLPNRETLWSDVADDVEKILVNHLPGGGKLYIVGFSKGGLGAFQLATRLRANALVTIDASPMKLTPAEIHQYVSNPKGLPAFWAIYTDYKEDDDRRRFQNFNEQQLPASDYRNTSPFPVRA